MSLAALADSWAVWSDEPDRIVLAYRPDVFDGEGFPAPCMPTIYVTKGKRDRRPGSRRVGADWYVTLYLEPEIDLPTESYEDREAAVSAALDLAERFGDGEIEPREHYQVPREDYLAKLEELTGAGAPTDREPGT